jgi:hypothetical protein
MATIELHVVTTFDEPVGEQPDDLLHAAIARRGDGDPGWGEQGRCALEGRSGRKRLEPV